MVVALPFPIVTGGGSLPLCPVLSSCAPLVWWFFSASFPSQLFKRRLAHSQYCVMVIPNQCPCHGGEWGQGLVLEMDAFKFRFTPWGFYEGLQSITDKLASALTQPMASPLLGIS